MNSTLRDMTSAPEKLWRNRRFRLLYAGYVASSVTDGLIPIAFTVEALRISGSPWALSSILIGLWAGHLLVTPLSGQLAATRNPLHVMVCADAVRISAQGGLLLAVLTTGNSILAMTISAVVYGAGSGMYRPAHQTLVPSLVEQPLLTRANGTFSAAADVSLIAGPALGLAALSSLGFSGVLAVDCATFIANIVVLLRLIPMTNVEIDHNRGAGLSGDGQSAPTGDPGLMSPRLGTLHVAWAVATRHLFFGASLLFWSVASVLIGLIAVVAPSRVIGETGQASIWAVISTVMAVCSLVGSASAAVGGRIPYAAGIAAVATLLAMQLFIVGNGFDGTPASTYFACAVFGAGALMTTWSGIQWTSAIQQRLARNELAKFSAVESALTGVGVPIGMALAPAIMRSPNVWLMLPFIAAVLGAAVVVMRYTARNSR